MSTDNESAARRDVVVIGASAGGVDAIVTLMRQMPPRIEASFFVVSHVLPDAGNHLVDALNTAGPLLAKYAGDGEEIKLGTVYVARPDRHLLVKHGRLRVTRGPRENRWRPAIDPLFRSAAVAYGNRVIGIVLTGMLDDGTSGLLAIKRCGGTAIVQDPEDAAYPEMPQHALANVPVDYSVPLCDMGALIERLVQEPTAASAPAPHDIVLEARIAETGYSDEYRTAEIGTLSVLNCPECGGPLWQTDAANMSRFRCRVGHAYGADSLLSAADEGLEGSLWAAVRMFDQRANILTGMAQKDRHAQRSQLAVRHEDLAKEARDHACLLRNLLVKQQA